ncbi:MAG: hypothetical protein N2110_03745 [Flavobacteriales bacterium]|nr:hypothetical protein [Flavobacteriales bacterium]MCX7768122.1 hypothetical protein [Flavobacteriales bacterium]MDW8409586.1 hypothetical protein [Flavobacteriales bacterium]
MKTLAFFLFVWATPAFVVAQGETRKESSRAAQPVSTQPAPTTISPQKATTPVGPVLAPSQTAPSPATSPQTGPSKPNATNPSARRPASYRVNKATLKDAKPMRIDADVRTGEKSR